jgi:hypothetical protein
MIKFSALFMLFTFLGCDSSSPSTDNGPVVTPPVTVPPVVKLTDDELLDVVQKQTFAYFWDYAESNSGMARERYIPQDPSFDQNIVTTGVLVLDLWRLFQECLVVISQKHKELTV